MDVPAKTLETRAAPGSFRELWLVALPMVLSSGSLSLMHFVDRVFLTWHSSEALAASTPSGMLLWTVMSVLIGTVTYVNTFVAQYEGAGRPSRVSAAVWQGIYLSLLAGVLFLIVVPFTDELFALIGHEPAVQVLEVEYFSIMCYGAVPMIMASALASFYTGRGETIVVMWVNLGASVFNGVFDYLLIFGPGPFPEWGIWGAGFATVMANVVAVVAYFLLMLRRREKVTYAFWQNRRLDGELIRRLLRYGLPTGIQLMADVAGITVFVFLVGMMGTTQLAATNLAFNLNTFAFIPMLGIGTAVMTLVGQRIGEGRPQLAVRTTWLAFALAGTYMLAFGAIYVLLPDQLLYFYTTYSTDTNFEPIRRTAVLLLRFVALYSFFDGMAIVFGSAIRGAGDTRFSLVFTAICAWLLMVAPTYVAWQWWGGSLMVSWAACSAYVIALGIGFLLRFQTGRWKTMRVIEAEALPDIDEPDTAEAARLEVARSNGAPGTGRAKPHVPEPLHGSLPPSP